MSKALFFQYFKKSNFKNKTFDKFLINTIIDTQHIPDA